MLHCVKFFSQSVIVKAVIKLIFSPKCLLYHIKLSTFKIVQNINPLEFFCDLMFDNRFFL